MTDSSKAEVIALIQAGLDGAQEAIWAQPEETVAIYEEGCRAFHRHPSQPSPEGSAAHGLTAEELNLIQTYLMSMAFISVWYDSVGDKANRDKAAHSAANLVSGTGLDPVVVFNAFLDYENGWRAGPKEQSKGRSPGTKPADIPAIAVHIVMHAVKAYNDDGLWKVFGFPRRPKWTGSLFRPFMGPANRELEPALSREIFLAALAAQLAVCLRRLTPTEGRLLLVHAVDLAVLGPLKDQDTYWCLGFRFKEPTPWGEHVLSALVRLLTTDPTPNSLTLASAKQYPSELVRKRWVSGFTVIYGFGFLQKMQRMATDLLTETTPLPPEFCLRLRSAYLQQVVEGVADSLLPLQSSEGSQIGG